MPGLQRIYSLPMAISEDPDRLLGEEKFFKTSLLYVFFSFNFFGGLVAVSIYRFGGRAFAHGPHVFAPRPMDILPPQLYTNCRYI